MKDVIRSIKTNCIQSTNIRLIRFVSVAEETDIYPELIGLDQDDPALIEAIKSQILLPPSKHPIKVSESSLSGQKIKG